MKLPRLTIASIGFLIIILAAHFALLRELYDQQGGNHYAIFAFFFLPTIDFLLLSFVRLRRSTNRHLSQIGFLVFASITTSVGYLLCILHHRWLINSLLSFSMELILILFHHILTYCLGLGIVDRLPWEGDVAEFLSGLIIAVTLFPIPPLLFGLMGASISKRRFAQQKTKMVEDTGLAAAQPALD